MAGARALERLRRVPLGRAVAAPIREVEVDDRAARALGQAEAEAHRLAARAAALQGVHDRRGDIPQRLPVLNEVLVDVVGNAPARGAVGRDLEHLVVAVGVRRVGDERAVGRPGGVRVVPGIVRQPGRGAPGPRGQIEVAVAGAGAREDQAPRVGRPVAEGVARGIAVMSVTALPSGLIV
jgi:hypothetical protein